MDLTKEQEETMAKVIKETGISLLRELVDQDDSEVIQDMIKQIFGEIEDDDKWVLCCDALVLRILKG